MANSARIARGTAVAMSSVLLITVTVTGLKGEVLVGTSVVVEAVVGTAVVVETFVGTAVVVEAVVGTAVVGEAFVGTAVVADRKFLRNYDKKWFKKFCDSLALLVALVFVVVLSTGYLALAQPSLYV